VSGRLQGGDEGGGGRDELERTGLSESDLVLGEAEQTQRRSSRGGSVRTERRMQKREAKESAPKRWGRPREDSALDILGRTMKLSEEEGGGDERDGERSIAELDRRSRHSSKSSASSSGEESSREHVGGIGEIGVVVGGEGRKSRLI